MQIFRSGKKHTFLKAIKIYNTNITALVQDEDCAECTLRRFKELERYLKEYVSLEYQKSDLNIRHKNHEFIDDFDFYMHMSKDNDTNTAIKHLKNLGNEMTRE